MFTYPESTGQYGHCAEGFAVVDLETTGLDPDRDRIVEIAVVRVDAGGREIGFCETLVDPGTPITGTAVHGISDEDVIGAPDFAGIASSILAWLEGVVVVAHNASFEESFLSAEFGRIGRQPTALPALDTLSLSQDRLPLTSHRLAAVCAWSGVELTAAHTALGDARATAQLLPRLLGTLSRPPRWDVRLPAFGCAVSGGYLPRGAVSGR